MNENTCKVPGCQKPIRVKRTQECSVHYLRFRASGDYTTKRTPSNATWDERLTPDNWTETPGPLETPCWIWKMKPNSQGYAVMKYHQKAYKVYRVMWERHNGKKIPPGINACHRCDTPSCVNPEHIFLGTQQDNIADMVSKGRQSSYRKLSDDEIRSIRAMVRGGMRQSEVSRVTGVDSGTVSRVVNRKLYRHVV